MIITFPVEITIRLMAIASRYSLTIPIPLSSPLQSYASPEELALIDQALRPLADESEEAAAILSELQNVFSSAGPATSALQIA